MRVTFGVVIRCSWKENSSSTKPLTTRSAISTLFKQKTTPPDRIQLSLKVNKVFNGAVVRDHSNVQIKNHIVWQLGILMEHTHWFCFVITPPNVSCGEGTLITTVYSKQADTATVTPQKRLQVIESKRGESGGTATEHVDYATRQVNSQWKKCVYTANGVLKSELEIRMFY